MRPRSLRIRIVAVTLLLLAVASALIAGVTTIELRGYLLSQLDEDVRVSSTLIVRTGPAGTVANPPPDLGQLPRPPDSLVAVVRDGAVVRATMYPPVRRQPGRAGLGVRRVHGARRRSVGHRRPGESGRLPGGRSDQQQR